jgi:hypothetical protein
MCTGFRLVIGFNDHLQIVTIGLLDVQNILSADIGISRQTEGHSFGDHLISESVLRHRVL